MNDAIRFVVELVLINVVFGLIDAHITVKRTAVYVAFVVGYVMRMIGL